MAGMKNLPNYEVLTQGPNKGVFTIALIRAVRTPEGKQMTVAGWRDAGQRGEKSSVPGKLWASPPRTP